VSRGRACRPRLRIVCVFKNVEATDALGHVSIQHQTIEIRHH